MLMPIEPQPGVFRNGTEYETSGRWQDANLVRWYGRQLGPIGGWRPRSNNAVTGKARTILPWKTLGSDRWIGIGTHSNLYVQNSAGQVFDITPIGFVAGAADESAGAGFGFGPFGSDAFGTPRRDTGSGTPALVWDLDTWGQYLVGCAASDGKLHQWTLNTAVKAAPVSGAPTSCLGLVVTEQGFMMALGAGGDPRRVQWSAQGDNTDWTPSAANQAGDIDLITSGTIVKGAKLGPLVLVLTDLDAHVGRYLGLPYVYEFERVGYGCGAMSKGCVVAMGQQAVWWSKSGFWIYDGSTRPIECEVFDFLTRNLNQSQKSKISGFHNAQYGEAWWFYPSAASSENDSYVYWDYRRDHWNVGALGRLCAAEPSVFKWPLAMDAAGLCYEHEVGSAYDGALPFAETGPFELGNGDQIMQCRSLIADEATPGQATVSFRTRLYPDAAETVVDAVALTSAGRADLRFAGRQVKMRVTQAASTPWRFGRARLELQAGGRR